MRAFLKAMIPLLALVRHRRAFRQFLKREIKARYRVSSLGFVWTVLTPLITLGIYLFVFGVVLESRWADEAGAASSSFGLVLFSGLIVFWLLADVVGGAPSVILNHPNLVKKAVFPLEMMPAVHVGTAVFHTVISIFVLLAAVLFVTGSLPATVLWIPVVLAPLVLLLFGLAWIMAAVGVYVRDLQNIVGLMLTGALFISPVFYSIDRLGPQIAAAIYFNPITYVVLDLRAVVLEARAPDWMVWSLYMVVAWAVSVAGYAFFKHARRGFADAL